MRSIFVPQPASDIPDFSSFLSPEDLAAFESVIPAGGQPSPFDGVRVERHPDIDKRAKITPKGNDRLSRTLRAGLLAAKFVRDATEATTPDQRETGPLLSDLGKALYRGSSRIMSNTTGAVAAGATLLESVTGDTVLTDATQAYAQIQTDLLESAIRPNNAQRTDATGIRGMAEDFSESLPSLAAQVGLAAATGGASVGLSVGARGATALGVFAGTAAAPKVGQVYQDALEEHGQPDMAAVEGLESGLWTFASEYLLGGLIRIPGVRQTLGESIEVVSNNFVGKVAKGAVGEGLQEGIETIGDEVIAEFNRRGGGDLLQDAEQAMSRATDKDTLVAAAYGAAIGMAGGGLVSGVGASIDLRIQSRVRRMARDARDNADGLLELYKKETGQEYPRADEYREVTKAWANDPLDQRYTAAADKLYGDMLKRVRAARDGTAEDSAEPKPARPDAKDTRTDEQKYGPNAVSAEEAAQEAVEPKRKPVIKSVSKTRGKEMSREEDAIVASLGRPDSEFETARVHFPAVDELRPDQQEIVKDARSRGTNIVFGVPIGVDGKNNEIPGLLSRVPGQYDPVIFLNAELDPGKTTQSYQFHEELHDLDERFRTEADKNSKEWNSLVEALEDFAPAVMETARTEARERYEGFSNQQIRAEVPSVAAEIVISAMGPLDVKVLHQALADHNNRGLGTRLVEAIKRLAKKLGIKVRLPDRYAGTFEHSKQIVEAANLIYTAIHGKRPTARQAAQKAARSDSNPTEQPAKSARSISPESPGPDDVKFARRGDRPVDGTGKKTLTANATPKNKPASRERQIINNAALVAGVPERAIKLAESLDRRTTSTTVYPTFTPIGASSPLLRPGHGAVFIPTDSDVKWARLPTLYSKAHRTILDSNMKKAPGSQWKAWLRKQPGIKSVELEWLNIDSKTAYNRVDDKQVYTREEMLEIIESSIPSVYVIIQADKPPPSVKYQASYDEIKYDPDKDYNQDPDDELSMDESDYTLHDIDDSMVYDNARDDIQHGGDVIDRVDYLSEYDELVEEKTQELFDRFMETYDGPPTLFDPNATEITVEDWADKNDSEIEDAVRAEIESQLQDETGPFWDFFYESALESAEEYRGKTWESPHYNARIEIPYGEDFGPDYDAYYDGRHLGQYGDWYDAYVAVREEFVNEENIVLGEDPQNVHDFWEPEKYAENILIGGRKALKWESNDDEDIYIYHIIDDPDDPLDVTEPHQYIAFYKGYSLDNGNSFDTWEEARNEIYTTWLRERAGKVYGTETDIALPASDDGETKELAKERIKPGLFYDIAEKGTSFGSVSYRLAGTQHSYTEHLLKLVPPGGEVLYTKGHWSGNNIFAHVRTTVRPIGGVQTLHGDEFQSDWFVDGRRLGVVPRGLTESDIRDMVVSANKKNDEMKDALTDVRKEISSSIRLLLKRISGGGLSEKIKRAVESDFTADNGFYSVNPYQDITELADLVYNHADETFADKIINFAVNSMASSVKGLLGIEDMLRIPMQSPVELGSVDSSILPTNPDVISKHISSRKEGPFDIYGAHHREMDGQHGDTITNDILRAVPLGHKREFRLGKSSATILANYVVNTVYNEFVSNPENVARHVARANELRIESDRIRNNAQRNSIKDFPFNDYDSWVPIALKYLLERAAYTGADWVTWNTGATQREINDRALETHMKQAVFKQKDHPYAKFAIEGDVVLVNLDGASTVEKNVVIYDEETFKRAFPDKKALDLVRRLKPGETATYVPDNPIPFSANSMYETVYDRVAVKAANKMLKPVKVKVEKVVLDSAIGKPEVWGIRLNDDVRELLQAPKTMWARRSGPRDGVVELSSSKLGINAPRVLKKVAKSLATVNGLPIPLYQGGPHSSSMNGNIIITGNRMMQNGAGIYLADDRRVALAFAEQKLGVVRTFALDIRRPLDLRNMDPAIEQRTLNILRLVNDDLITRVSRMLKARGRVYGSPVTKNLLDSTLRSLRSIRLSYGEPIKGVPARELISSEYERKIRLVMEELEDFDITLRYPSKVSPGEIYNTVYRARSGMFDVNNVLAQHGIDGIIHANSDIWGSRYSDSLGRRPVNDYGDSYIAFHPEQIIQIGDQIDVKNSVRFARTSKKTRGRPDLANPGRTDAARALVDDVDEARNRSGRPPVVPDTVFRSEARRRIEADRDKEQRLLLQMARQGVPFGPTETYMAKEITNQLAVESLASGDVDQMEQAMQFADAYRESGTVQARAFRQRRDEVMTPQERMQNALTNMLTLPGKDARERLLKLNDKLRNTHDEHDARVLEKRRSRIIREQAEQLDEIRTRLSKMGLDPRTLTPIKASDPVVASKVARTVSSVRASTSDKVFEFFLSMILSGPQTHMANTLGNTVNSAIRFGLVRPTEVLINTIVRDPKGAQVGELPHMYGSMFGGIVRGTTALLRAYRTEAPTFMEDFLDDTQRTSKLELHESRAAIKGTKGRIIRLPSLTTLLAFDEFFKAMGGNMESHAMAYRVGRAMGLSGRDLGRFIEIAVTSENDITELDMDKFASLFGYPLDQAIEVYADVRDQIRDYAMRSAKEITFQDTPSVIGQAMLKAREVVPGLRYLVPFVSVPDRIFALGLKMTPLGTLPLALRSLSTGMISLGFKADGVDYRVEKDRMVNDAAFAVLGWGVFGLLWALTGGGGSDDDDDLPIITGSSSPDYGKRGAQYRTAPPMSVRIDDKYYSYRRLEPAAVTLATTVDLINEARRVIETDGSHSDAAIEAMSRAGSSVLDQMKDKTFLQTLGDLTTILTDDNRRESTVARVGMNFVTAWVPNLIKQPLRNLEPGLRDTTIRRQDDGWWGGFRSNLAYSALPLPQWAPPPRVDIWGREIRRGSPWGSSGALAVAWRLGMPIKVSEVGDVHPLDLMIANYNRAAENGELGMDAEPLYPRPPTASVNRKAISFRMTDEEYHRLTRDGGQRAASRLMAMGLDFDHPGKREYDAVRKAFRDSYGEVRDEIVNERLRQEAGR